MKTIASLSLLALLASTASAQEEPAELARFRFELGFAGGNLEHMTDGSNLDGEADAGMFRLALEAFGSSGWGGGVRYEGWATDDDLFDAAGIPRVESTTGALFAHFSYRFAERDFTMPLRTGLLFHAHRLDDRNSDQETDFATLGVLVEVAPEVVLTRSRNASWSLHGTLGLGAGVTQIDSDALVNDFDSATTFFGFELGTRVKLGAVDIGLSYVLRRHEMDRSDPEGGLVVFGYDSTFDGVMLSFGASF